MTGAIRFQCLPYADGPGVSVSTEGSCLADLVRFGPVGRRGTWRVDRDRLEEYIDRVAEETQQRVHGPPRDRPRAGASGGHVGSTRLVTIVAGVMVAVASASPAGGWANGTGGCNSFGTHDWILKKAIKAAGKKANWVRVRVALRATDDPDCKDGIDHASGTWWHVYDRWGGEWGDADEAAAVWFRRTKRRLANGKKRAASKALGILAHIIGDVAQPMHTDSSEKEDGVHSPYEDAVDSRIESYAFGYDGGDRSRGRPRARRVARQAHRKYWPLVHAYDEHGYNTKVHCITKRQLKRAANAMADLITSLR